MTGFWACIGAPAVLVAAFEVITRLRHRRHRGTAIAQHPSFAEWERQFQEGSDV